MQKKEKHLTRRSALKVLGGTAGAILSAPMITLGENQIQPQKRKEVHITDKPKPRMMGGMFGLEDLWNLKGSTPPFLKGREVLLVNGRSGILLLIELLSPTHVWMPSYLCHIMITAAGKTPTSVRFYEVNYDLNVPSLEWLDKVQRGDLVILIDYFGFIRNSSLAIRAKQQGAYVLEDAAQALLSPAVGSLGDFVLFSPRKFLGVPDGGILAFNREKEFDDINLESPPGEWWLKALFRTILRREYDIHGGSLPWFELCAFKENDEPGPIERYSMSELSKRLLIQGFDYAAIIRRRVDNYQVLADELGDIALFPNLSNGVVPMGFPIRIKNRDHVRQVFFDHKICFVTHWPIQGVVPEEFRDSHRLAAEIMTLPCDQRYDRSDMYRLSQLVLKEARM